MTDPASAADLDRELQRQTAALQGSVAAAQERAFRAETAEHQAHAVVADRDAELVAVREQLALARRELHWLRRAGIDLNRVMDHPALRAGRLIARRVRRSPPAPQPAPAPLAALTHANGVPVAAPIPAMSRRHVYTEVTDVLGGRVAPLVPGVDETTDRPLRLALIVPHFSFGSGGHHVMFQAARSLELRGHAVSYWIHDPFDQRPDATGAELRSAIREQYAPIDGPVFNGFAEWAGADIVLATGWQTVYAALGLDGCRARAYMVNDHEPEFYPTSLESQFATRTYELGLPCLVGGGPWLADLLTERYGAEVVVRFPYPVAAEFRRRDVARRQDTLVLYGRNVTPRRGVGLALIALEELKRRRPDLRVVLFGDEGAVDLNFAYEHHGAISPERLSWVYSEATIGIAFSLTHGSLVPHDMMACGLPVMDLAGFSTAAEHAGTDLVELVPSDPTAMADALERLLDDDELRARRSRAGQEYVAAHTWEATTSLIEDGLRAILRARVPQRQ